MVPINGTSLPAGLFLAVIGHFRIVEAGTKPVFGT
jgi:hypothetical protein